MADKIRLVTENDLPGLEKLFRHKKKIEEIRWMLQSPDNPEKLNGYIAENENGKIVGMIGFEVGIYYYEDRKITGSTFMSWKIAADHKGFAGVMLLNKALSMGDFGMAIQGSEFAQNMYSKFNLVRKGSAYTYFKLLKPFSYFFSLRGRSLIKRLGNTTIILKSFFCNYNFSENNLTIKRVDKDGIISDIPYKQNSFLEKYISKNYLLWLLSCPIRDSYAFEITKGDEFLGYTVCFIEQKYHSRPKGRIVYMPNMGNDNNAWYELIEYLIKFFKEKKCCAISVLGLDDSLKSVMNKFGFVNYKTKQKPIYIRNTKKMFPDVKTDNWFMQYTEGDKTYRNM